MSEIWSIPSPYKWGTQKSAFFRRLQNLAATLTAYIFGIKKDVRNPVNALETTRGFLYTSFRKLVNFGPQTA